MEGVSFSAFGLWLGINMLLMLGLALNVTRFRFRVGAGDATEEELQRVIRAHGNNIEYVPVILLGLGILTAMGLPSVWMHVAGVALLVARVCHAHGIQQPGPGLPKTRVVGNIATWVIMLAVGLGLVVGAFL